MQNINKNLDYKALGERLKKIRGKESQSDFANKYGLSQADVSRLERGEVANPSIDDLFNICINNNRNFEWLLYGDEPEYREEKGKEVTGKAVISPKEEEVPEGFVRVNVYSLAGAGGPKELVEPEPIDVIIVPREYVKPSIYSVKVRGNSMEPTIADGAVIGVDKEDRQIISGKIYAVWIPYEGAVIKRLYVDMEKVILKSDNTLTPTSSILLKDIPEGNFVIGRVKWVFQKL